MSVVQPIAHFCDEENNARRNIESTEWIARSHAGIEFFRQLQIQMPNSFQSSLPLPSEPAPRSRSDQTYASISKVRPIRHANESQVTGPPPAPPLPSSKRMGQRYGGYSVPPTPTLPSSRPSSAMANRSSLMLVGVTGRSDEHLDEDSPVNHSLHLEMAQEEEGNKEEQPISRIEEPVCETGVIQKNACSVVQELPIDLSPMFIAHASLTEWVALQYSHLGLPDPASSRKRVLESFDCEWYPQSFEFPEVHGGEDDWVETVVVHEVEHRITLDNFEKKCRSELFREIHFLAHHRCTLIPAPQYFPLICSEREGRFITNRLEGSERAQAICAFDERLRAVREIATLYKCLQQEPHLRLDVQKAESATRDILSATEAIEKKLAALNCGELAFVPFALNEVKDRMLVLEQCAVSFHRALRKEYDRERLELGRKVDAYTKFARHIQDEISQVNEEEMLQRSRTYLIEDDSWQHLCERFHLSRSSTAPSISQDVMMLVHRESAARAEVALSARLAREYFIGLGKTICVSPLLSRIIFGEWDDRLTCTRIESEGRTSISISFLGRVIEEIVSSEGLQRLKMRHIEGTHFASLLREFRDFFDRRRNIGEVETFQRSEITSEEHTDFHEIILLEMNCRGRTIYFDSFASEFNCARKSVEDAEQSKRGDIMLAHSEMWKLLTLRANLHQRCGIENHERMQRNELEEIEKATRLLAVDLRNDSLNNARQKSSALHSRTMLSSDESTVRISIERHAAVAFESMVDLCIRTTVKLLNSLSRECTVELSADESIHRSFVCSAEEQQREEFHKLSILAFPKKFRAGNPILLPVPPTRPRGVLSAPTPPQKTPRSSRTLLERKVLHSSDVRTMAAASKVSDVEEAAKVAAEMRNMIHRDGGEVYVRDYNAFIQQVRSGNNIADSSWTRDI